MKKKCITCDVDKDCVEFAKNKFSADGLQYSCKSCSNAFNRLWHQKNKEKINSRKQKYYEQNPEAKIRVKIKQKERYELNKDKIRAKQAIYIAKNKDKIRAREKEYRKRNRKEIQIKENIRKNNNKQLKLNDSMRSMVSMALNGKKAGRSWKDIVGYTVEDLVTHLESKFTKGMTWENYGKNGWEVDHIIPRSYFKFDNMESGAFKACWALKNLQPLWRSTAIAVAAGEDSSYIGNLEKGNNIVVTEEIRKFLEDVNQ